jgi:hypothetical protein
MLVVLPRLLWQTRDERIAYRLREWESQRCIVLPPSAPGSPADLGMSFCGRLLKQKRATGQMQRTPGRALPI